MSRVVWADQVIVSGSSDESSERMTTVKTTSTSTTGTSSSKSKSSLQKKKRDSVAALVAESECCSPKASESERKWRCEGCTTVNGWADTSCYICTSLRRDSMELDFSVLKEWICLSCDTVNVRYAEICDSCCEKRPTAEEEDEHELFLTRSELKTRKQILQQAKKQRTVPIAMAIGAGSLSLGSRDPLFWDCAFCGTENGTDDLQCFTCKTPQPKRRGIQPAPSK